MSDTSATVQGELLFDGNGSQQYHQPGIQTSFDGLLEINNPATTLTIVDNLSSINSLGNFTLLNGSVVNTATNIFLGGNFVQSGGTFTGGNNAQSAIQFGAIQLMGGIFTSTLGNLSIAPISFFSKGLDFTGSAPGAFVPNNGTVTIVNDAANGSASFNPQGQTFYNLAFYRSVHAAPPFVGTPVGIKILSNAVVSNNCTIRNDSNFAASNLAIAESVQSTITVSGTFSMPQNNTSAGTVGVVGGSNMVFELNAPTSKVRHVGRERNLWREIGFRWK